MYGSEIPKAVAKHFGGAFDARSAAATFETHLAGATTDHVLALTATDRNRIFNLGYYTWVEQLGVTLEDFEARRDQAFWHGLRDRLPVWDALISEFNGRTGLA